MFVFHYSFQPWIYKCDGVSKRTNKQRDGFGLDSSLLPSYCEARRKLSRGKPSLFGGREDLSRIAANINKPIKGRKAV